METSRDFPIVDLLIIGGGINGTAIARDAAGRGLSVVLCEQGDIGGATSSASSKMIHGGLRYLEHYEFRLVAQALAEREVMLRIAPHLARPLSIAMPHVPNLRPAWMIRLGLLLYDTLGRWRENSTLPRSRQIDLHAAPYADTLKPAYQRGFVYADLLDDDARLTLATAKSAALLSAQIRPHTRFLQAEPILVQDKNIWRITLEKDEQQTALLARVIVNAAGPWVAEALACCQSPAPPPRPSARLVKGSHIVVPRMDETGQGWLLQNDDGRVIFVLPFEEKFSLIGTTEIPVDRFSPPHASPEEIDYLCRAVNRFFQKQIGPADVCWYYAGLRPLYEDGHATPSALTRDYVLHLEAEPGQPALLSVFGGKLTTHRRLAESVLEKLAPIFPRLPGCWTDQQPLPGGDFESWPVLLDTLTQQYPALPSPLLKQLAQRHGNQTPIVLGNASNLDDLGQDFGGGLHEREVDYFVRHEWACQSEDILWRRSKAGLHMTLEQREHFNRWFAGAMVSAKPK